MSIVFCVKCKKKELRKCQCILARVTLRYRRIFLRAIAFKPQYRTIKTYRVCTIFREIIQIECSTDLNCLVTTDPEDPPRFWNRVMRINLARSLNDEKTVSAK